MKVRIYKAPDGKGKFVNKLGSFMQKAARKSFLEYTT